MPLVYDEPNDDSRPVRQLLHQRLAVLLPHRRPSSGILNVGLKANAFYYGMISRRLQQLPARAGHVHQDLGRAGRHPGQFFGWGRAGIRTALTPTGMPPTRSATRWAGPTPTPGRMTPPRAIPPRTAGTAAAIPATRTATPPPPARPSARPDGSMEGFDVGDPAFSIAKAVLPSTIWNDVMSYCSNQWISDYTYTGMYN